MARLWVRPQIITRAQYRADMVNSQFVSPAEWADYYNEAISAYWTIMRECSPADFAISETTISTLAGITMYSLPADFSAMLEIWADEGNGQRRPLLPVNGSDRAYYRPPQTTGDNVVLRYQQSAPVIVDDVTAVDYGELGDALVVRLMALAALTKEESDTTVLQGEIAAYEAKLRATRQRDRANAQRIRDVDAADIWLFPNQSRVRGYFLVGGNIELYQPVFPYPG